ncbi:MAG: hypothetical protein GWP08_19800, partial [Nitrospiraceae bacterium]|nr:hypothetical protein [Nitrospiraceae bacterium]
MALAVMTILLAIGLTFFTVSRLQLKTSTNVENTVRADLLANAATSIAINVLKQDKILNPTATSLDHAWRSRFNGSWIVGKHWAYPGLRSTGPNELPGLVALHERNMLPRVYYHDELGQDGVAYTDRFGDLRDDGRDGLMDHLYVPRREDNFVFNGAADYDPVNNPFVVAPERGLTPNQIGAFCDVDNDGDGIADSVWIPLVGNIEYGNIYDSYGELVELGDGIDNDLSIRPGSSPPEPEYDTDGDAEPGIFLYFGGGDGYDNDGDGQIDEQDENEMPGNAAVPRVFVTAPILDPDGNFITLYNVEIPTANGTRITFDLDTDPDAPYTDAIDNDYDGIINRHKEYYAYIGAAPQPDVDVDVLTVYQFELLLSRGAYEICPTYLDATLRANWRIASTGEPVSELVGRAAILITDEASKVNLQAAG